VIPLKRISKVPLGEFFAPAKKTSWKEWFGVAFSLTAGIAMEGYALLPLFADFHSWSITFPETICWHVLANMIMAWGLQGPLPARYRTSFYKAFCCYFTLGFFIPVLANIGLLMVFIFGVRKEKLADRNTKNWRHIPQPLMPNQAPDMRDNLKFGGHGMPSRLLKSDNLEDHLGIVLATRFMRDENAVPLLYTAIKSPLDDVRLLAFSLLEKRSAHINGRIEVLQDRLEFLEKGEESAKIHVSIANCYLRLVTLELIQAEMKTQALEKARRHLAEALDSDASDRNSHFALGQVLLAQGKADQAQAAFSEALNLGFAPMHVYPMLARTAYMKRQFGKVPKYLKRIPFEHRNYPPLANVAAYWLQCEAPPRRQHLNSVK